MVEKVKINLERIPKEILPSKILGSKGEVDIKKLKVLKTKGCEKCFGTGYKGRIGIYEMFKITPKIEEVITMSPSIFEMRKTIIEGGMITTQQDGLLKVVDSITTLEELERVTGPLSN
jgi:type IV pilus assembly protein PilB